MNTKPETTERRHAHAAASFTSGVAHALRFGPNGEEYRQIAQAAAVAVSEGRYADAHALATKVREAL